MDTFNLEKNIFIRKGDDLKKEIITFFSSKENIYIESYDVLFDNYFHKPIYACNFVGWCVESPLKFGIDRNEYEMISLGELIEIFYNIHFKFKEYLEQYIKFYNAKHSEYIYYCEPEYDFSNLIWNKINRYFKENNIEIKPKENNSIFSLDFYYDDKIFETKNKNIKHSINDFLKIKNSKTDKDLVTKSNIICGLKNEMDNYFKKNEENIIVSEFFKLNPNIIKSHWQTLFSHLGKNQSSGDNVSHNDQLKEWYKNLSNEEKHLHCNNLFDAIIFIRYKLNL